ncbi:MAG: rod shape-determining protein RodA [bacterium]|nr:rod shape-determining protein RodA [bacterium]
MKLFKGFDLLITLIVFIIGVLGMALMWSLAPHLFFQQLSFFILGFGFFFIFSQIDFRIYRNFRWFIYLGVIFFLLITFILGEMTRGSVRWIQLGPFTMQPSEIVKPFLLVFFAFWFADRQVKFKRLILGGILFLLPVLLVFRQPDLGSTLVLIASLLGMLLTLERPFFIILYGFGFLALSLPLTWAFLAEYQKQRIFTFLNPNSDPLGSGYSIIQSVISVGSGELFGRGLGRGTQSHLAFLPERHTDFIFASFTEELGFAGAMLVLILYLFLLWRILQIAKRSKSGYAQIFIFGVFAMLLFQIFVNIGMNLGVVPVTGITLPFLSYGGSSILATMILLGMVESIARSQKSDEAIDIR